jgi:hypothetical protein
VLWKRYGLCCLASIYPKYGFLFWVIGFHTSPNIPLIPHNNEERAKRETLKLLNYGSELKREIVEASISKIKRVSKKSIEKEQVED